MVLPRSQRATVVWPQREDTVKKLQPKMAYCWSSCLRGFVKGIIQSEPTRPVVQACWVLAVGIWMRKSGSAQTEFAIRQLTVTNGGTGKQDWNKASLPSLVDVGRGLAIQCTLCQILSFSYIPTALCNLEQKGCWLIDSGLVLRLSREYRRTS